MSEPKVVTIRRAKESEARAQFGNYVQSVAFNLTLSRSMIESLRIIRDDEREPLPTLADPKHTVSTLVNLSHALSHIHALQRRGLVWHDWIPPDKAPRGHRNFKLTRAGTLTCEMLVEAGLLAAAAEPKRRRA